MSSTQTSTEQATQTQIPKAGTVETKLEVVILPVSDVERAKRFYMSLGWRLDADFTTGDDWRAVQLMPLAHRAPSSSARDSLPRCRAHFRERFSSSMTSRQHEPSSSDAAST